ALSRAWEEVRVPWRHLVTRGHSDAPGAAAAGIGFVTVSMCDALVRSAEGGKGLGAAVHGGEARRPARGARAPGSGAHAAEGVAVRTPRVLRSCGRVPSIAHVLCFLPLLLVLGHWLIKRKEIGHRSPPWMEISHFRAGFGRRFRARGEEMRRALEELCDARGRAETHPFVAHV